MKVFYMVIRDVLFFICVEWNRGKGFGRGFGEMQLRGFIRFKSYLIFGWVGGIVFGLVFGLDGVFSFRVIFQVLGNDSRAVIEI